MCVIVDANVVGEVFGTAPSEAGAAIYKWIERGGLLVAGGQHLEELENSQHFAQWSSQALQAGTMQILDEQKVKECTKRIERLPLQSNDPHVLAVAQLSGARLLFSNDENLWHDFRNKRLIDSPRGRVFQTKDAKTYTNTHRRLLGNRSLCRAR